MNELDDQPPTGYTTISAGISLALSVVQVGGILTNFEMPRCSVSSRSSQTLPQGCTDVGISITSDPTRQSDGVESDIYEALRRCKTPVWTELSDGGSLSDPSL